MADKRTIKISCDPVKVRHPRGDRYIALFAIVVEDERSSWEETYGSLDEVMAFFRGLQAAGSMLGVYFKIPPSLTISEKTEAETEVG